MVNQMWKRVTGTPMAVIKKKDLNPFLVTHMNFVHAKAWEVTLVRRWGTSPFTGEANWADGSDWVSEPSSVLIYVLLVSSGPLPPHSIQTDGSFPNSTSLWPSCTGRPTSFIVITSGLMRQGGRVLITFWSL